MRDDQTVRALGNKTDTMLHINRTFKCCTFCYRAISHIRANYQLICVNGNKSIDYLIVVLGLCIRRNPILRSGSKSKTYFKNRTTFKVKKE